MRKQKQKSKRILAMSRFFHYILIFQTAFSLYIERRLNISKILMIFQNNHEIEFKRKVFPN